MNHALLSPSSANRWLICTKSARLEETLAESTSNYADEGTLAHELSELMLKFELKQIKKKEYKQILTVLKANELYNNEMFDYCSEHIAEVLLHYYEAKHKDQNAIIYLEQNFDLSRYIEEGHGTCDVVIIGNKQLHVIDLKYGKGIRVQAEDNPQLKLYALGAYAEFIYACDIEQIKMTIHQPRINNSGSYELSVKDLIGWTDNVLKIQAAKAFLNEGEFIPGNHCQFCKAKAICRAHRDYQMNLAKYDFMEPALLDNADISAILDKIKSFETWIEAVKAYSLEEALKGQQFPDYKLVEGRSVRKYSDEEKVLGTLIEKGFDKEDVGRFKLFGITEIEKEIGKKVFDELVSPLLIKPPGKPVLVHESDKRPAFNSILQAQKDFDNG